jgi:hypothetical protein
MHAENFMTGLKVVFDRRRSVLGWEKFDCECFYILDLMNELDKCGERNMEK